MSATGLSWRLTNGDGDELEPAWSADGRDLAWIERTDSSYALMLRRRGQPDVAVVEAELKLSTPAWRTDGSLLTFLRHDPDGPSLEMAILSEPVLLRVIESKEDFVAAPVSWRDRQTMYYTGRRSGPLPGFRRSSIAARAFPGFHCPGRVRTAGAGRAARTRYRQRTRGQADRPGRTPVRRTLARLPNRLRRDYRRGSDNRRRTRAAAR